MYTIVIEKFYTIANEVSITLYTVESIIHFPEVPNICPEMVEKLLFQESIW